jgi:hypothetical protein
MPIIRLDRLASDRVSRVSRISRTTSRRISSPKTKEERVKEHNRRYLHEKYKNRRIKSAGGRNLDVGRLNGFEERKAEQGEERELKKLFGTDKWV